MNGFEPQYLVQMVVSRLQAAHNLMQDDLEGWCMAAQQDGLVDGQIN
ncbi:hypothetical protein [Andreprevotia chitinilytica]|nr:hypothetical protein [Andreprevotia chitinilytica]